MVKAKQLTKTLWEKAHSRYCNIVQNNEAKEDLKLIESHRGRTNPSLLKHCDEYAQDVLGSKVYAPWLYVYSALAEEFKEGWIPDNYYREHVVPVLQGDYGRISFLKPFVKNIFRSNVFPDIGAFVNGIWLDLNLKIIAEDKVQEYLFSANDKIVFKTDENPYQGLGVYFFDKDTFDLNKIRTLGNGVFQEYIKQHPFFKEIMPDSVGTIRLTTVVEATGDVSVRSNLYRIGRSSETHVVPHTEIVNAVDVKTGEFSPFVYLSDYRTSAIHPDTGYSFAGKYIPSFSKCVDIVLKLHSLLPQVRCIGWDLIVDENEEVKVMEWNGAHNDIKFAEATQGPCFVDLGWDKLHLLKENPFLVY